MARLPVCMLLVCATGTAHAQLARYPRDQPPIPAVELSDRVKPTVVAIDTPATRPSITSDVVLSVGALRGTIRTEQEQILVALIQNTPDTDVEEKSDYYFRLGELYAKQFTFWHDQAGPQAATKAKEYLLRAVKTYKGLTDNDRFQNYPKMDLALFYYGYTLQSGKYMKEARAVYDKLLKNYPSSRYVPEAHLAFAEYFFDANQLADAEARYKKVLEFPKSSAYAYALYKVGWIHLLMQRHQEAIQSFYQVLVATQGDPKQSTIADAARMDLVRTYAAIGKPERVFDALGRVDKSTALDLVVQLGEIAHDAGLSDREATTYRGLLARAPADPRACDWQYRTAHAVLTLPSATNATKVAEIESLVRIYLAQKEPDDECRENAAAMAGELASAYHAEWSKTQNLETLGFAERLYAAYTAAFADDEDRRMQYAEALWSHADRETRAKVRAERFSTAADVFATIDRPDAARAAALARMNALDVVIPAAIKLAKLPRSAPRPRPLPAADAKLVAAVASYAKLADTADADLPTMRLAVAITLRKYRRFEEAAIVLDDFIANHRDHARLELAAILLLDSLIQANEPGEAREVAATMAADLELVQGKPELQRDLAQLRQ